MPPVCVVTSCWLRHLTKGWQRICFRPTVSERTRWGVSYNNSGRGKIEWSSMPTRKASRLLLGCVVLAVHHFTEETISFQNVGSTFGSQIHKNSMLAKRHLFIDAANSRNELTFAIRVMYLGSEETLLVSGLFLSGLDWRGPSELAPCAGPGAFFCWRACGSEWLVSSDYWTWPGQQL